MSVSLLLYPYFIGQGLALSQALVQEQMNA